MNNATNSGVAGAIPLNAPVPATTSHDDHDLCLPLAEQGRVPFITPGVMVLMGLAAIGTEVVAGIETPQFVRGEIGDASRSVRYAIDDCIVNQGVYLF